MTFVKQFTEKDILKALTDTPASATTVGKRAGCSVYTAKNLLNSLYKDSKVQRVEIEKTDGISYAWKRVL